jgi:hypothetical protein
LELPKVGWVPNEPLSIGSSQKKKKKKKKRKEKRVLKLWTLPQIKMFAVSK